MVLSCRLPRAGAGSLQGQCCPELRCWEPPAALPIRLLGAVGRMGQRALPCLVGSWKLLPALCPHHCPSITPAGTQGCAQVSNLCICSILHLLTSHTSKNILAAGMRPAWTAVSLSGPGVPVLEHPEEPLAPEQSSLCKSVAGGASAPVQSKTGWPEGCWGEQEGHSEHR